MQSVAVLLQARMGSSRLPGKALALLGRRTLIERCIARLRSRSSMPVVLATTRRAEDDPLAELADRAGVPVVRGAADDVLDRVVEAIARFGLDVVVRATGDNPAVDADGPQRTVALLARTGVDHVVEGGLPIGTAVEAIAARALRQAAELATDPYDREHVTPFIRRDRRFRTLTPMAPTNVRAPRLRLTVDTPEDLAAMRRLIAEVGDDAFDNAPLADIVAAARQLDGVGNRGGAAGAAR
ncbi:MAG: NTP transferase domain-containing protein [Acidobacteria bacterium]|nr:NTP transferase domain-containing protein [Acidobacteriota bacterium]